MTIRFSLIIFIISSFNVFSQEEITVEKIWKYYNYYPNWAEGYNAMSDGVSYSVRERDNSIIKIQPLDEKRQPQTLAEYSPDGNQVSYIYENNIYVKNLKTGIVTELTSDGEKNAIINGTTDWVYEEEFAFIKAYDWSPDSKYIAYLKFDERQVKEFNMTFYNELYPESYDFKYPKAGEENSKVSVHIADMDSGKQQEIFIGQYEYIPRMEWSPSMNQLILQSMNRHQSILKYHLVDLKASIWTPSVVFEEKSETYVDVDDNLVFLKDGNSLLRTSEIDGYKHIYKLSFDGTHTQVTSGKWDVIDFLGLDTKSNTIYYSSCEPHATQKSVYGIQVNGKNKKELTTSKGYNDAEFLKGMKYFIHTYSNANTPPVISLKNAKGKLIETLEDNSRLAKLLSSSYTLSPKTFSTIETDNAILNTWMILPHYFVSTKKYPVYFNVYGGP